MSLDNTREALFSCARNAKNCVREQLRKILRACVRPFRHASPTCAFFVLTIYASLISVATWLATELFASDALDADFALASIPLTCTVLGPAMDAALLSTRSEASRYLGVGVRISGIDPLHKHRKLAFFSRFVTRFDDGFVLWCDFCVTTLDPGEVWDE